MIRFFTSTILLVAACQPAPVGVQNVEIPRDSTAQCANQCAYIGLGLDSVVIMANNLGCVCRVPTAAPPSAAPASAPSASGSAGGVTAIMIAQQQEAARRRNAAAASQKR